MNSREFGVSLGFGSIMPKQIMGLSPRTWVLSDINFVDGLGRQLEWGAGTRFRIVKSPIGMCLARCPWVDWVEGAGYPECPAIEIQSPDSFEMAADGMYFRPPVKIRPRETLLLEYDDHFNVTTSLRRGRTLERICIQKVSAGNRFHADGKSNHEFAKR